MLRRAGCSFLRAEGFSCSFCVLHEGLGMAKWQLKFLIQGFKTLDSELDPDRYPDLDPQLGKVLDLDPH
jgi:hypothetical protein